LAAAQGWGLPQHRIGLAHDGKADWRCTSVELEERDAGGHDAGQVDDLAADRLRGCLRGIVSSKTSNGFRDERALPCE
jgi:hypothetical protein